MNEVIMIVAGVVTVAALIVIAVVVCKVQK